MSKLFDVALEWLRGEEWSFTEHERENGDQWTRSSYSADNSKFDVVLDAREKTQIFFVYVYFPLKVPEKNRVTVSELLTRLNFNLKVGNFELDMNDGEIRYKVSVDIEGSELVTKMIQNMVSASLSTSDTYFPAVMHICYGNKTAVEALAALDSDSEEEQQEVVETQQTVQ